MLRVKEVATAELLTSQLPEVHVVSTVVSSSVSDTNDPVDFADFASRNEDRIARKPSGCSSRPISCNCPRARPSRSFTAASCTRSACRCHRRRAIR